MSVNESVNEGVDGSGRTRGVIEVARVHGCLRACVPGCECLCRPVCGYY